MDTSMNDVTEHLADLSSVELQQVIQLAKTLQYTKSAIAESPEVLLFFSTLCEEVTMFSSFENPPLVVFKGRDKKSYGKVIESVSMIQTWANAVDADVQTRLKKRNLYAMLAMLVSSYLNDIGVPITLKTLLNSFHKFPSLVDKAFPGYVESGLIHMVLARSRETKIAA